jgi:hypothetical protein
MGAGYVNDEFAHLAAALPSANDHDLHDAVQKDTRDDVELDTHLPQRRCRRRAASRLVD